MCDLMSSGHHLQVSRGKKAEMGDIREETLLAFSFLQLWAAECHQVRGHGLLLQVSALLLLGEF